ncbi:hypothetical protein, partial [Streptomyces sp. McG8]|uniref:hypothetical protein n=1 Tax=Streptomyces sp. McG8 TaxID=2725487 RepID=UPI001BE99AC1
MAGFFVIPGQLLCRRVVSLLTSPLLPLFRYRLKESEEWGAGVVERRRRGSGAASWLLRVGSAAALGWRLAGPWGMVG